MSRETDCIIQYLKDSGVPHLVTSINTGKHIVGSYHFKSGTGGIGLAVDFDDFATPAVNTPGLDAIWAAFALVEDQLEELAYLGAPYNIKSGERVRPYDKANHVHVAVKKGTFLKWVGTKETPMPTDNPDVPNLSDIKFFEIVVNDGVCTGYYMVSSVGEVHGHGPGAPYLGRSEVVTG